MHKEFAFFDLEVQPFRAWRAGTKENYSVKSSFSEFSTLVLSLCNAWLTEIIAILQIPYNIEKIRSNFCLAPQNN